MREEGTDQVDGHDGALKLFWGRICCVVGLLQSTGGFVIALLGASGTRCSGRWR